MQRIYLVHLNCPSFHFILVHLCVSSYFYFIPNSISVALLCLQTRTASKHKGIKYGFRSENHNSKSIKITRIASSNSIRHPLLPLFRLLSFKLISCLAQRRTSGEKHKTLSTIFSKIIEENWFH